MSTSRSRTDRSPARRVLAVCALTGAALLTTLTGGQAWADGSPQPAATAPGGAAAAASPSAAPATGSPTAAPAPAGALPKLERTGAPTARPVPKGAAAAGDGSGASDGSGMMLAGGGAVAAIGAGALGFAVLRRRSGARG